MKKISVVCAAAFLLLGSSLAPAAAHRLASSVVTQVAFPDEFSASAHRDGKQAAIDWYNATSPSRADLTAEYEMARQNRLDAEPNSYEYWYWTGYQFQVGSY